MPPCRKGVDLSVLVAHYEWFALLLARVGITPLESFCIYRPQFSVLEWDKCQLFKAVEIGAVSKDTAEFYSERQFSKGDKPMARASTGKARETSAKSSDRPTLTRVGEVRPRTYRPLSQDQVARLTFQSCHGIDADGYVAIDTGAFPHCPSGDEIAEYEVSQRSPQGLERQGTLLISEGEMVRSLLPTGPRGLMGHKRHWGLIRPIRRMD